MPVDIETLSHALEALSDGHQARKKGKHVKTLRGVRGVSDGDLARLIGAAWSEHSPAFPDDGPELRQLFFGAHEDGLVAIGLLAAMLPDDPEEALELGLDLLESVDDVQTGDALGWLVIGPGTLSAGRDPHKLVGLAKTQSRHAQRRAVVMASMAWLPEPLDGPAAAALRARLGQKTIAFVDRPLSEPVHAMMTGLLRDESPIVRKGLRRVIRAWGEADNDALQAWVAEVHGGLPKLLRTEVVRADRRAKRAQARAEAAASEDDA